MRILSISVGIGSQSCLAWFLGPESRGSFAICIAFASLLGTVFLFGTDRAIQYHVLVRRLTVTQGVSFVFFTVAVGSTLAGVTGWFVIDSPIPVLDKAESAEFRYALLLIPVLAVTGPLNLLLGAQRRFAFRGWADVADMGSQLVLIGIFVGAWGFGVTGAIGATLLAGVVSSSVRFAGLRRKGRKEGPPERAGGSWAGLGSVMTYGMRYYVARLGKIVNAQIGVILLGFVASRGEIGLFAVAAALIGRILIVPESISAALLPRIVLSHDNRSALVAQSCRFSAAMAAGTFAAVLMVSGELVPLLLSPAFALVTPLLFLLTPAVLARACTGVLSTYFIAVDRPGVISLSTGLNIAVNATVLFVLYPRLGLFAAAVGVAMGSTTALMLQAAFFHRTAGLSLRQTWTWQAADTKLALDSIRSGLARLGAPTIFSRS